MADHRDRQVQNRSQVQFEFTEVLTDQGDQACVMGSRGQLRENHLVTTQKKLHAEQTGSPQVVGDGSRHGLGLFKLIGRQLGRLPAALIVTSLLLVADGWAEQGVAVALTHRQQGDLQIEPQKLLDDHPR